MMDLSESRWKGVSFDLPKYTGFMANIEKFDGKFFGIPKKRVDAMDPQSRILLEHAYEAIFDAGVIINHNCVLCVSQIYCNSWMHIWTTVPYYQGIPGEFLNLILFSSWNSTLGIILEIFLNSHFIPLRESHWTITLELLYNSHPILLKFFFKFQNNSLKVPQLLLQSFSKVLKLFA
jgi:hypothetical protein